MPSVVGVRVHIPDTLGPVLHSQGRSWSCDDDVLHVLDEAGSTVVAAHAPGQWSFAELVHAEHEQVDLVGTVTTAGGVRVVWDPTSGKYRDPATAFGLGVPLSPADRVIAAQQAVDDAQRAAARSAAEHANAVEDAQRVLANLLRELGEGDGMVPART